MTILPYTQNDFSGGMNLIDEDTDLEPNQYRVGINIRTRFGDANPIKDPVEIMDGLPNPLPTPQGLYAFGNILVMFSAGMAFYKTTTNDVWAQIPDLLMDAFVSRIYCCAVPQATLTFDRKGGATPSDDVTLEVTTTLPNPVCLVVQDGINQPWLIFDDGTAIVSKTYAEWDTADREYVPIGLQMAWFNGILFVVSPDGKRVYRSVTGRPLDFVVAIDAAGVKVADAEPTSFAVDSNDIKLMSQLNADSLIIITAYSAYAVQLNIDKLLYGEPTFNQTFLFQAGASNNFSFADILGDYAFIDKEGLKSFNAVSQLKFEGNNSVFSFTVASLFREIVQDNPCCGSFDNYTFFAVKTTFGNSSVLVFDNIKKVFASIDLSTPQAIRQFASTYDAQEQRFFCITSSKVYELFSPDVETFSDSVLFTRGLYSKNSDLGPTPVLGNVKTAAAKLMFKENETEGSRFKLSEYVNEAIQNTSYIKTIPEMENLGVLYPVLAPVVVRTRNRLVPFDIPMNQSSKEGQKTSYSILWTGGAKLTYLQFLLQSTVSPTTKQQQQEVANGNS